MHQLNILLHVTTALAALALGLVQLARRKGGPGHLRRGRLFVLAMTVTLCAAALGALVFRPDPTLIATTALVAYLMITGVRTLRRRAAPPDLRDAGLAAVAAAGGASYLALMAAGVAPFWKPVVAYSLVGSLILWSTLDLALFARGGWRSRSAAQLDHGARMTFAVGGLLSAGTGTVAPGLAPWSQVGPSAAAVAYVLAVLLSARLRNAPGASP